MSQRFVLRLLALACVVALFRLALLSFGAQPAKGKSFALIVGVRDYEHSSLATLKYTENDAEELAKILDRPGSPFHKNVRILTCRRGQKSKANQPTAANIRKVLAELVKDRTRRDTVLIALSGHGMELTVKDPVGKDKEKTFPFFCPSDTQLSGTDYKSGHNPKLVSLIDLMNDLGNCGAGSKLVLVDACRNELQERRIARSLTFSKGLVPAGVAALFSCKSGAVSFETPKLQHGVFFHFVLEGLRGKAKNADGEVNWNDLTTYVIRSVKRQVGQIVGGGAEQIPQKIETEFDDVLLLGPVKKEIGYTPRNVFYNSIHMKLVRIPPGVFTMGSPRDERDREENEGPLRRVTITKAFYMGAYEVAQGEYEKVMGTNPSWFSKKGGGKDKVRRDTSRFPVETVSFKDAVMFCRKLSAKPGEKGRVYRLPTEAEWEYACRAGSKSPFSHGNTLSSLQANFDGSKPYGEVSKNTYRAQTCEVGLFNSNAWGLYDMHGNVWEWCSDFYSKDYYRQGENVDPRGPKGTERVLRGGCWSCLGRDCRSAVRGRLPPNNPVGSGGGFRVVCIPQ